MKKLCSKCRQKKDTKEFGKLSSSKDGLKYWCKNCNKKDAKTYQRGRKLLCHTPSHGTTKKCRICKIEKPLEEFNKWYLGKYGRKHECKACQNKDYKKYKHKIKKQSYALPLGSLKKCTKCKREIPIDLFSENAVYRDGKGKQCKDCDRKAKAKQRKKNIEKLSLLPIASRPVTKICSRCKKTKDISAFNKASGSIDGLHCYCKQCSNIRTKLYSLKMKTSAHLIVVSKKCRICKKEKPIEDFPKDLVRKDGRDNRCRVCLRKRNNKYEKHKKQVDPEFRIMCVLRSRVRCAVRDQFTKRAYKTEELVGCSVAYLIGYLESQFDDKMTWDNYGKDGWHIDHIKPCAAFDLTQPEEQKKCFNYKNLQPLWWPDNIRKRSWYKGKLYLNKP